jgi:hypothetical protein
VNRTGEHGDAVPADLVAEVLAGDADGTRASRTQDIHIQVVPLLRGQERASSNHHEQASTPVLVRNAWRVKRCVFQALENKAVTGFTLGTWSTYARDCSRVCSLR